MISNTVPTSLGIDVSKRTFNVCLLMDEKSKSKKFDNNESGFVELREWLNERVSNNVHACMEATGRYHEPLANYLASAKYVVSVVNPLKIKGYSNAELTRSKTDHSDAALIARFCQKQQPKPWKPISKEVREVQESERYLDALKGMKLQESNRLSSGLVSDTVKQSIQKHISQMESEIAALEKSLKTLITNHERLAEHYKLITSVIGIGDLTAFTWLGEIGYGNQFDQTRQVESFTGLTPRKKQSGTSILGKERMSKIGNHYLRKALFMPAMCAMQYNPAIRAFAEGLRKRGKAPKLIVGAVMRKLVRIIFGVVRSGIPFDSDYQSRPTSGFVACAKAVEQNI